MKGLTELRSAKPGSLVPVYETRPLEESPLEYFQKISNYGRKENCMFLESTDFITRHGERSLGSARPCLRLYGKQEEFHLEAINSTGRHFLRHLTDSFPFADELSIEEDSIRGIVYPDRGLTGEEERMNATTHADVIRAVAFRLTPVERPFSVYGGLFGMIGYDFIDQFEELPQQGETLAGEPDYDLYFYDNLFLVDHRENTLTFIVNALIFEEEDRERERQRVRKLLDVYRNHLNTRVPDPDPAGEFPDDRIRTDTSRNEYKTIVSSIKDHIDRGDVFQAVPSRTLIAPIQTHPLTVYETLRSINPSPYMFYVSGPDGVLLGSSPEMCVKVEGEEEKTVEIRPIAGTKPRGKIDGEIDPDLDSRFETELKTDHKELAEHSMLIDLARNDVARVSKPGTRYCETPFVVEKYSSVQHLVSNVQGILRDDLDALHAYLATMNMGTLTGAPKYEAMKLLRTYEKSPRGFYGGAVGYLTPSGDLDSAIVIRSLLVQNDRAYLRAGAGIVYDSDPEQEFEETEQKLESTLSALRSAHKRHE